jgi:hypothetical protein
MLQTDFKLSDVEVSDAQDIGHHVEVPAMQNGPLYRTMFPQFNTVTEAQKEQITRWYIEMLEDAFQAQEERFLKVCSVDGTPVGFCGWIVIEQNHNQQQAGEPRKRGKARNASWLPDALNVDGWVALSKDLKAERCRVLKDLDSICRKLNYVILVYHTCLLIVSTSRTNIYGGTSEVSTTRNRFNNDAAYLSRNGSARTMCICARSAGGGPTLFKVWFRDCRSC